MTTTHFGPLLAGVGGVGVSVSGDTAHAHATIDHLPADVRRQLRLLERQLWKKTMLAGPVDRGGMWALYGRVGDMLRDHGWPNEAVLMGYQPALQLCGYRQPGGHHEHHHHNSHDDEDTPPTPPPPQHMLRKQLATLLKVAAVERRYLVHRAGVVGHIVNAVYLTLPPTISRSPLPFVSMGHGDRALEERLLGDGLALVKQLRDPVGSPWVLVRGVV